MTRILLTRHGETEYNIKGMFQGWQDSPLTQNGIINAEALSKRLKNEKIDACYVSTSARTKSTAKIVLGDRDVCITELDDLKELGFGRLENTYFDDLFENVGMERGEFFGNLYKIAENAESLYGGENISVFEERIIKAFKNIVAENEGKTVLIVTHANPALVIMRYLAQKAGLDTKIERLFQTSLSEVVIDGNRVEIIHIGDTSHFLTSMKSH